MKLARVFPRRTKATPRDDLVFIGAPPAPYPLFPPDVDRVHVSVSFTLDIPEGERLAKAWADVAPTDLGGPALKTASGDFVPGRYLRHGYVITSRGCPLRCWFCPVWKTHPEVVELPIRDGWLVQDDNLLACSERHIRSVFEMLMRQPKRAQFTGGLEPAFLRDWHVELLTRLRPEQIFSAYDTPDDKEPLILAGRMLQEAGFTFRSKTLRCYVLIGYKGDTFELAEERMKTVIGAGFWPMAMLWRSNEGHADKSWSKFQRLWVRPAIIYVRLRDGQI